MIIIQCILPMSLPTNGVVQYGSDKATTGISPDLSQNSIMLTAYAHVFPRPSKINTIQPYWIVCTFPPQVFT